VWVYGETPGGSGDLSLFVGGGPLRLRCAAGADLLLDPSQRFEVIKDGRFRGEYKVRTLAYVYKLEVADAGQLTAGTGTRSPPQIGPTPTFTSRQTTLDSVAASESFMSRPDESPSRRLLDS
jgi:hypothetical protein